jgi:diamine N-acetyltransferase
MTESLESLQELIQELPPDLHQPVREGIELLLARRAHRGETEETPDPGPDAAVTLREITAETVREICRLSDTLAPPKRYMVAPNAVSIAQAHFEPHAWFRAIYAGETPVGFVMLYDDPDEQEYFLWRLMIAGQHHGKGFGRRGLEQVIEYVKTRPGARMLRTSCGQGAGSPEAFYEKIGFRRNGEMIGDEVGLSLDLDGLAPSEHHAQG